MKTSSIKTTLPKLASIMLLLFLILILPVNVYIQLHVQHQSQRNSTIEMFGQLEQLIQTNEEELKREEQEFKEICIRAADMVAYYIKHSKQFVPDVNGCRELAKKMNVDEIHFLHRKVWRFQAHIRNIMDLLLIPESRCVFLNPCWRTIP